jgi:hypothetical protein
VYTYRDNPGVVMLSPRLLAVTVIVLCSALASGKDKKKSILPADVLKARTVLVVIDPSAGVDVANPNVNRIARADVEKALDQWGRFTLVQEGFTADLVMVVRKGNGRLAQSTIGGTPINGAPPVSGRTTTSPSETTARGGVRWGGNPNDPSSAGTGPSSPQPQLESGPPLDMLTVYRGSPNPNFSPLDSPPVWRYYRKDALDSPSVPAVDAFRKDVTESEKQLASHP